MSQNFELISRTNTESLKTQQTIADENTVNITIGDNAFGAADGERNFTLNPKRKKILVKGRTTSTNYLLYMTNSSGSVNGPIASTTYTDLITMEEGDTYNVYVGSSVAVGANAAAGSLQFYSISTFESTFPNGITDISPDPSIVFDQANLKFIITNLPIVSGQKYYLGRLTAAASNAQVIFTSTMGSFSVGDFLVSVTEGQDLFATATSTGTVTGEITVDINGSGTEIIQKPVLVLGPSLFATGS